MIHIHTQQIQLDRASLKPKDYMDEAFNPFPLVTKSFKEDVSDGEYDYFNHYNGTFYNILHRKREPQNRRFPSSTFNERNQKQDTKQVILEHNGRRIVLELEVEGDPFKTIHDALNRTYDSKEKKKIHEFQTEEYPNWSIPNSEGGYGTATKMLPSANKVPGNLLGRTKDEINTEHSTATMMSIQIKEAKNTFTESSAKEGSSTDSTTMQGSNTLRLILYNALKFMSKVIRRDKS